ncbi:MAG: sigma-70 family RNA polymerase sigma factor [Deltaproteobacteria bacterium]|nr:sigma-70 family RNA polymerase sigma factor [Deltaproteobacteria bacterium]
MTRPLDTAVAPQRLADRELRHLLEGFIGRRVPRAEVDDLVQTVLCDALAARRAPNSHEDLRRWLVGIARHKIADHYRTAGREHPTDNPQVMVEPPPYETRAMVHWAEGAAKTEFAPAQTLGWMAREGEGESLATIAAEEQIPAARIRQRVSRMRRTLKQRWAAELAVAVVVVLAVFGAWQWWTGGDRPRALRSAPIIVPDAAVTEAGSLRREGLRACDQTRWQHCLELLDRARELDPSGDRAPAIGAARQRAAAGIAPSTPAPSDSAPTAAPSTTPTAPAPSAARTSDLSEPPTPPSGGRTGKLDKATKPAK